MIFVGVRFRAVVAVRFGFSGMFVSSLSILFVNSRDAHVRKRWWKEEGGINSFTYSQRIFEMETKEGSCSINCKDWRRVLLPTTISCAKRRRDLQRRV